MKVDSDQHEKILQLINVGKKEGAKLCTGGGRKGDRGYYVQPTVFADVQDNMTIARDEVISVDSSRDSLKKKWCDRGKLVEVVELMF